MTPSSPEVQGHTPGPWRIEAVSDAVRIIVGKGRQKIILARLCPKQIPETETLANARIMASALDLLQQRDDLLAALQAAYKLMNHMGDILNGMDCVEKSDEDFANPIFEQVRAAIRRATEGQ